MKTFSEDDSKYYAIQIVNFYLASGIKDDQEFKKLSDLLYVLSPTLETANFML